MDKDSSLPPWMQRDLTENSDDVVPITSSIMFNGTRHFFTGAIGEFIRSRKGPRSLDMALDMEHQACVVRMEYEPGGDGRNRDQAWRALYTYMDLESFALLWNREPADVHGIPSDRIALHLKETDLRYPILTTQGHHGLLFFENGRFWVTPDPAYEIDPELVGA